MDENGADGANGNGDRSNDDIVWFVEKTSGLTPEAETDTGAADFIETDIGAADDFETDVGAADYIETDTGAEYDTDADTGAEDETDTEQGTAPDDDEFSAEKNKTKMELYDWMQCFVSAIICGILIFVFCGKTIGVEGESMMQTLHGHDRVIMSGLFYTPKAGDIIIFNPPTDAFGSTPLVKRVIALENQTIDIDFDTGQVFVDGRLISKGDPRYVSEATTKRLNFVGPYTVPEGHVFVMGDNRDHSSDSRDSRIGAVDTRYILGKVLFLLVPGGDQETPRDWGRMGFIS